MFESSRLLASIERQWSAFTTALPEILLAVVLLFAGWLLAKIVRRLAIRFLRAIRFDVLAERAGIRSAPRPAGTDTSGTPSQLP